MHPHSRQPNLTLMFPGGHLSSPEIGGQDAGKGHLVSTPHLHVLGGNLPGLHQCSLALKQGARLYPEPLLHADREAGFLSLASTDYPHAPYTPWGHCPACNNHVCSATCSAVGLGCFRDGMDGDALGALGKVLMGRKKIGLGSVQLHICLGLVPASQMCHFSRR